MKIDNAWIKYAMEALCEAEVVAGGVYKNEFKGYIASLGAAIVQSGLLPAMIFFGNDSDTAKDRKKIEKALRHVLWKASESKTIRFEDSAFKQPLAHYLLALDERKSTGTGQSDFETEKETLYRDILKATVALKLALRLFAKDTNNKE